MAKPHTRQQARQAARRQAKEQARHAPKGTVQTAVAKTRQEKKELARLQREEIRRRIARRKRRRALAVLGAGAVAVGAVVAVVVLSGGGSSKSKAVNPASLPGIMRTAAPWPSNTAQLDARIGLLGLPSLSPQESLVFHIHQHLDIFVHGKQETVPAQVGITAAGGFAALHTHDTSGVMHVESPAQRTFTLGDFFDVWGLYFTQSCVGTYCAGSGSVLQVYVNGRLQSGDPTKIALSAHQEIAVVFGTPSEAPKPIPSSFAFPQGE